MNCVIESLFVKKAIIQNDKKTSWDTPVFLLPLILSLFCIMEKSINMYKWRILNFLSFSVIYFVFLKILNHFFSN